MLNHGISTGGLFLAAGMLYDRRHTHVITEFGGLATPMPVFSSLFLFICLSSAGLPMLNGFIGEFLILNGTYLSNAWWATLAATGVILSAVYLLWSYQRLIYGPVTVEKNQALPDVSARERISLAGVCVMALFMGVASPLFTARTESTVTRILEVEMARNARYNAAHQPVARPTPGATRLVAEGAPSRTPVAAREDRGGKAGQP